jgi:uncharacterized protein (DUF2141 family)
MKSTLLALALGLFATATYAQNCNIGNQDTTGFNNGGDPFSPDYLLGTKFTLANAGTLNAINFIGRTTTSGTKVRLAVYRDNSGVPSTLVASSDSILVTAGVVSLPVTATALVAGSYWVMAVYNINGSHVYNKRPSTTPVYYSSLAFNAAMPTSASSFILDGASTDFCYFLDITCTTTGVETMVSANNINIYPNPAKDLLTLQTAANMIGQNYMVIDQLGRQVLTGKVNNETSTLDISQLQAGMYFLKVGAQSSQSFKFVKE